MVTLTIETPVITIDGPSGVGKGTISLMLADKLGYHLLDSGALYRIVAYAAQQYQISLSDVANLYILATNLPIEFKTYPERASYQTYLEGQNISELIRDEAIASLASQVARIPEVRRALLKRQRDFRQMPGLVADGRDMGTVVFPEAKNKFFLTATGEERAQRRYLQLQQKGLEVSLEAIKRDITGRDDRDRGRSVAPLVPATDAECIDTTQLSICQVFDLIMEKIGCQSVSAPEFP